MSFYINKKAIDNPKNGINYFSFRFSPTIESSSNKYHYNKGFEPYSWRWDGTREGLFQESGNYGCSQTLKVYCAKLIQFDGWQIKDDYPCKF